MTTFAHRHYSDEKSVVVEKGFINLEPEIHPEADLPGDDCVATTMIGLEGETKW